MTAPRRAARPTLASRIGAWLGIWRETPEPRRADPEYLAALAKAWDEGYAMSERELDHAYGGHPISPDGPSDLCHECGTGNPYRADGIEGDR